jgi:hypothetical protein
MGQPLGTILAINGMFSAVSGTVLLVTSTSMDERLGLETWFLAVVGAVLIGYGWLIAELGKREDPRPGARFATAMDIAWVIGSAIVLIGFPSAMTTTGRVGLLMVSIPVAALALVQIRRLRADSP